MLETLDLNLVFGLRDHLYAVVWRCFLTLLWAVWRNTVLYQAVLNYKPR